MDLCLPVFCAGRVLAMGPGLLEAPTECQKIQFTKFEKAVAPTAFLYSSVQRKDEGEEGE
jgi:hypothetical protein